MLSWTGAALAGPIDNIHNFRKASPRKAASKKPVVKRASKKTKVRKASSINQCDNQITTGLINAKPNTAGALRAVFSETQKTCKDLKSCFTSCQHLGSQCGKSSKGKFDCNRACEKAGKRKSKCLTSCKKSRKSFLSQCKRGAKGCKKSCTRLRSTRSCKAAMKAVVTMLKKSKIKGRSKTASICKKAYKL